MLRFVPPLRSDVLEQISLRTCADDTISGVTCMTCAIKRSLGVCAVGVFVTIMGITDVMRRQGFVLALRNIWRKNRIFRKPVKGCYDGWMWNS